MPKLTTRVKVIAFSALAVFIAAFLPWWGVTVGSIPLDVEGWSAGIACLVGVLLLSAAGLYLVLRRLKYRIWAPPFGDSLLAAGLAAAGLLLVIIRWASGPSFYGSSGSTRYGIWLAVAAGVVETAAAVAEAFDGRSLRAS